MDLKVEKEQKIIHPVDKYVGYRLRQRRAAMSVTQQQLANAIGIKFQQIQKYETGVNRVSASRLWDIACVLETDVSYFFDGVEDDENLKLTRKS